MPHLSSLTNPARRICVFGPRQTPGAVPKYKNMLDCVRQSVSHNGLFGGPLQGFNATLLRNIPAAGVYFGTFETLKVRCLL